MSAKHKLGLRLQEVETSEPCPYSAEELDDVLGLLIREAHEYALAVDVHLEQMHAIRNGNTAILTCLTDMDTGNPRTDRVVFRRAIRTTH